MNISANKVVEIAYTLTVRGEIIDQSGPEDPLAYLHGHNNIISGLEKALEGKTVGDSLSVVVSPEEGYGEREDAYITELSRKDFDDDIEVGGAYYGQTDEGEVRPFTVIGIDGDVVSVDFNHPLAGDTLEFDVHVVGIRDATEEELEHGHAHGDDLEGIEVEE